MNILLIAGGWSSEREVSLSGARQIHAALETLGHRVTLLDPLADFDSIVEASRRADFAFLNLHGAPGEDGIVQALLDASGCPYQGSGARASLLALDKAASKQLFRQGGLLTPDWELLTAPPGPDWRPGFGLPAFFKPNAGGSSVGMSLVREAAELPAALDAAFAQSRAVLAEPALDGPEVTCAVLGGEALPPILIKPKACIFFDYQSKYVQDAAEEICPAPLPGDTLEAIRRAALAAHGLLGLAGYSRSDFILTPQGPSILETNTLPGMTSTSLLPRAARVHGLEFPDLLARLIELGLAEKSRRSGLD
ncbi:D-alanine--D-alanine ligase [Fundidesulfovibrio magnetotacticus]|uniref:D-alanine--D-alanine ligase n=1 Tax=Fundidesulfovibrio magnetotacticus TaxID=2730080 RepID=A0A6V8LUG2_9BACT|nr:D-alanine--D-alanine ligase [Fundidesulfovibrio magnetotacticus]GFK96043.1 D-alanine--D-alanine ligase [Fundidesulfovibrio magnetotacticus]